jgi:GAF domain.
MDHSSQPSDEALRELYAESQRQQRQMEALADVARAVSESLRLDEVLRLILGHATSLLHTDGACISFLRGERLEVVAAIGTGDPLVGMSLPLVGSMSGRAVRTGESIVGDATTDPEAYPPTVTAAFIRTSSSCRCPPPAARSARSRCSIAAPRSRRMRRPSSSASPIRWRSPW